MRRILVDGSMAKGGGGFTYLVNILPRLAEIAPNDRVRVLVRSERLAASLASVPGLEIDLLPDAGWRERLAFTYLQAPRLAKQWAADVYFSAGESAPPRAHCPVIASFRNPNVFTSMDQGWPWKQRLRLRILRELARVSAWTCERIMFVSEDSSDWIGESLGIPTRRRAVVHHGIDADRWTRPSEPGQGLEGREYVLSVSSVYRYKNYVRLIEAYAALARRRPEVPDLVIIGDDQDPEYSRRMQQAREATGELAQRIHILGEVPYSEVKAYYAAAALFVFPSYLETFGHPLLEAMASDVPVVAADIAVFREIGGDAAFYADPHKADALASAMEEALYSPRARETLVKRGRERVREFSWDRTARRLLELFDEVIAERASSGLVPARTAMPASLAEAGFQTLHAATAVEPGSAAVGS
jgi:glycosyltransferase involved in cell wall biosynthesis